MHIVHEGLDQILNQTDIYGITIFSIFFVFFYQNFSSRFKLFKRKFSLVNGSEIQFTIVCVVYFMIEKHWETGEKP